MTWSYEPDWLNMKRARPVRIVQIFITYIDNFLFLDYDELARATENGRRSVTLPERCTLSGRDDRSKKEGCCGGTTLE